ncbi:MAG: pilus assembly protein [Sphingomonadales bacterium]
MKRSPDAINKLSVQLARLGAGLKRRCARLIDDNRGMSMIMGGFAIIPMAGAVALAYDTSQAYLVKNRLSVAVDAAALAGGRVFFEDTRNTDIRNYFNANFPPGYLDSTELVFDIQEDQNAGEITVTAAVEVPTTFIRVLGINKVRVNATGTTTRETSLLDAVLAIDVSGSMLDPVPGESTSRIAAARTAATELVNILYGDPPSPNFRLGVVPWGGKVNVTDFGTTFGVDSGGNPLPIPTGDGTPGSDAFWAVSLGQTYDNPYLEDHYTFNYFEGSSWAPNDQYVATDPLDTSISPNPETVCVRWRWGSCREWETRTYRKRTLFGRNHDGSQRWESTYNKVWYAHNSPVPLLTRPPEDWTGCVYARYAYTGDPSMYDPDDGNWDPNPASGMNRTSDADEAADLVLGPVNSITDPNKLDWMGWMPIGAEGEEPSGSTKCDSAIMLHRNEGCTPCPSAGVFRLQNNKQGALDMIATLNADGPNFTNMPVGLGWAWRVLMPAEPFTEASVNNGNVANFQRSRALILLTDGANTVRAGDAYNRSFSSQTRRDNRLRELATIIKQNGTPNDSRDDVLIYTIQFANNNSEVTTLLKDIATSPDAPFYNYAPSTDDLQNIFRQVATNLANLRISR